MTFPEKFLFFLGSPKKMTSHRRLKAFSGVSISREFPIPGFFQESGIIIEYSHFPVPDLLPRDTTLEIVTHTADTQRPFIGILPPKQDILRLGALRPGHLRLDSGL